MQMENNTSSENQITNELTQLNERKLMFKSLTTPYQHSASTQHYIGIENQSTKKLTMITNSHHVNQGSKYQMICT
jgi:hypothetical protein